jgi:hypothetical protein
MTNNDDLKYLRLKLWEFKNVHGMGKFSDKLMEIGVKLFEKLKPQNTIEMIALWVIVGVKYFDTFDFKQIVKSYNLFEEEIEKISHSDILLCKELLPLKFTRFEFEQGISSLEGKLNKGNKLVNEAIQRANDWVSGNKIIIVEDKTNKDIHDLMDKIKFSHLLGSNYISPGR